MCWTIAFLNTYNTIAAASNRLLTTLHKNMSKVPVNVPSTSESVHNCTPSAAAINASFLFILRGDLPFAFVLDAWL